MRSEKFDVLEWFEERGYNYKKRYEIAIAKRDLVEAAEIVRDAEERYMDWVTDPLD